jgi:hypothetical protein
VSATRFRPEWSPGPDEINGRYAAFHGPPSTDSSAGGVFA